MLTVTVFMPGFEKDKFGGLPSKFVG